VRLLLRADASPGTGVGHLVRCLALAEEARRRGNQLLLAGDVRGEWALQQLYDAGIRLVPAGQGAADLASLAQREAIDIVHVDNYDAPDGLRDTLNRNGIRLSNFEDGTFGRRQADLVVDPTVGARARARPDDGSTVLARGSAYIPLRSSVLAARDRRLAGAGSLGDRLRVLVVMGGTDARGAVVDAVGALVAADVPADVLAVTPVAADAAVAELMATARVRVRATDVRADLPALLAERDLVVCAAGTTVWELCCIGTPMAIVHVTDNQRPVHDALIERGAALGLGGRADLEQAAAPLRGLLRDGLRRRDLALAASALVDGAGAERVIDLVEAVAAGRGRVWLLSARPAVLADADLLLAWRNDPDTRGSSRQQDEVDQDAHQAWLRRSVGDPSRLLLVLEDEHGDPVGTVRWDRLSGQEQPVPADWEVSITVAPRQRGAGLARPLLAEAQRALTARAGRDQRLLARVHVDNVRSQRLFESSGYQRAPLAPDELGFVSFRKDAAGD
jgi:spore coat polysaccharide biosynthesis predicted glycosyltransferase SpsG/RimJ/RimL family protein N-acetyltransferase